eukprot:13412180-Alexandrium_andersonii.AAC.1
MCIRDRPWVARRDAAASDVDPADSGSDTMSSPTSTADEGGAGPSSSRCAAAACESGAAVSGSCPTSLSASTGHG